MKKIKQILTFKAVNKQNLQLIFCLCKQTDMYAYDKYVNL